MTQDPYSYPGTNVLRNIPDIKDPEKLSDFEYTMASLRELQQIEKPVQGNFDLKHLQKIHKELFQDVYDWAGEIRTVGISKGGTSFARPEMIEPYANSTVFKDLKKDNLLQGMEKEKFVERLSHHFAEINALHPFREGNGRATRVFVEELGKQAGYSLDFDKVEPDAWINASRECFNGRMKPIEKIFDEITTPNRELDGPTIDSGNENAGIPKPERAVAFRTLPIDEALGKHPDLEDAYADLKAVASDIDPDLPEEAKQRIYTVTKETIALQLEHEDMPARPEERISDEVGTQAKIHNHAIQEIGRHSNELRENPNFDNHGKEEIAKAAYFRGVYEMSCDIKGESPNFKAYDEQMSDRNTLRQMPEVPGLSAEKENEVESPSRSNTKDDLSL